MAERRNLGLHWCPVEAVEFTPVMVTDLDFADDIALISDTAEKARELLLAVERECRKIWALGLNAKKTKVIAYNINDTTITTLGGEVIEVKEDFKYLGS